MSPCPTCSLLWTASTQTASGHIAGSCGSASASWPGPGEVSRARQTWRRSRQRAAHALASASRRRRAANGQRCGGIRLVTSLTSIAPLTSTRSGSGTSSRRTSPAPRAASSSFLGGATLRRRCCGRRTCRASPIGRSGSCATSFSWPSPRRGSLATRAARWCPTASPSPWSRRAWRRVRRRHQPRSRRPHCPTPHGRHCAQASCRWRRRRRPGGRRSRCPC
mmetsp:Transcript_41492/g.119696  ORF Transcript_41492/g.119696 Transcript_41492/m.119696 type:complete len:221 (+) Transcript_41492:331-993(+)